MIKESKIETVGDLLYALIGIDPSTPIAACWEGHVMPIQAFTGEDFVILNVDGFDWLHHNHSVSGVVGLFTKEDVANASSYWEC